MLAPTDIPRCQKCSDALAEREAGPLCVECARTERHFERAVAYAPYGGVLRELVHLLKYQRVRPAAGVLGRLTASAAVALANEFESDEVLLIPVPLHKARYHERGFNQAERIAEEARSGLTGALGRHVRLETVALIRRRPTEAQFGLRLDQRMAQMKGAFRVVAPERVKDREILLVDDVLTTGATVSECSRVLLRAGARKVCVATAARAMQVNPKHESELIRKPMQEELTASTLPDRADAPRAAHNGA